jgi:hypothetical protein
VSALESRESATHGMARHLSRSSVMPT